ncbi:MAG TPA: glycosyltransferase [Phycisphaerales bacterium]|nr:glycosyltransferase [Phycisphaerales bacterium]
MAAPNRTVRVLYVASDLPCPPGQGSHLRILNVARQLAKAYSVTFVYAGPPAAQDRLEATRAVFGDIVVMPTVSWPLTGAAARLRHKVQFHWPWYHAAPVARSDKARFARLHREHDLTWFHTLAPADSLGLRRPEHAVVDLDDLNHVKYRLKLAADASLRLRTADRILAYKWSRWERRALDRFDAVAVCSREDRRVLGDHERIVVIPNGFDKPAETPTWTERRAMRLGFLGHLGYTPNRDGMHWYAREVWPKIQRVLPSVQMRLVGRHDPRSDFSHVPGFTHLGFVEDVTEEMATWSAMVVPLQFGGGTRLKILEAFSRMCPVVATPVGAYGLDVTHERDILLSSDPEGFAARCVSLLQDPAKGQPLAEAAWRTFVRHYDWDVIGDTIRSLVRTLAP